MLPKYPKPLLSLGLCLFLTENRGEFIAEKFVFRLIRFSATGKLGREKAADRAVEIRFQKHKFFYFLKAAAMKRLTARYRGCSFMRP